MEITVADEMIGPAVELRDPVRLQLLEELQEMWEEVPQRTQAVMILCDIRLLRHLVEVKVYPDLSDFAKTVLFGPRVDEIVAQWRQLFRSHSTASSAQTSPPPPRPAIGLETQTPEREEEAVMPPPPKRRRIGSRALSSRSSAESRSRHVSTRCKERDAHRCVISKLAGPLDAAHIVPYSLNREDKRDAFFNLIKNFWTERSEKLRNILKDGTELVENMLTFTPTVHSFHSAGLFALQPVDASHDGKSLKLKFYWLQQRESHSSTMVKITDLPEFPNDVKLEDINMYSSKDGHLIQSGEVIELTTSDPEKYPLPNWDLLEIQWILQRLTALRGAPDIPDTILSESEDPSGYGYSEEEVEEEEEVVADRINNWIDTQPIQQ
ncbi:hypothetical protein EMPG_10407 [Blastomyces silverae]|uniref:HNH nuclease domain-containing protein n=1 Tax=Blastomyces silverae TaxID=2060906 RepID=A0A0H1B588_9EURO|nr:hypothetical protein EMPG_10407 [Blastomyces silverae]